ncbi:hypothetical protein SAMN05421806_10959 [Streptomyces indicus]|uniref:Uncharacterized protein n=2 Tax=Streptomyces indicus TaxID=417292 RepID=A0A1G9D754_9ACTN|nr:hypothetical protein SAMN05421806_10959 [Streptomyces indicus]
MPAVFVALTWGVRVCAVGTWVAVLVAGLWTMGVLAGPPPYDGPLLWGWIAAGCALGRPVLLWIRLGVESESWRWGPDEDETEPLPVGGRVSLSKGAGRGAGSPVERAGRSGRKRPRRPFSYDEEPADFAAPAWVKLRRCLALLPVAVASAAVFGLLGADLDGSSLVTRLQRAGAQAAVGTVVEQPRKVTESRDDEGTLQGHTSELRLQVPGAERPLTARGAATEGRPERGDRFELLWSPADPGLGAYVSEGDDMAARADPGWELFPARGPGEYGLFVLIIMLITACAFGLPLALAPDADELHEQAWAPWAQTGYGVVVAGTFLLQRPLLLGTGMPDNVALAVATALGFLIPLFLQITYGIRTLLR